MEQDRIRVVHHAQALFAYSRTVVRIFIIGRLECFVESFQLFPHGAWREKKSGRTIVDVAAEHVHRGKWIIAASITQARTVAPDDAARFLQGAIEKNLAAADG